MKYLSILISYYAALSSAVELDGLDFQDNQMQTAWIKENDRNVFHLPYFPVQFSFCSKIFVEFERYNTYSGLFYIADSNNLIHLNPTLYGGGGTQCPPLRFWSLEPSRVI